MAAPHSGKKDKKPAPSEPISGMMFIVVAIGAAIIIGLYVTGNLGPATPSLNTL